MQELGDGVGVQEAARILKCSANAVRMKIRHKTIAAYKSGHEWRVLIDEQGRPITSDRRIRHRSDTLVNTTDELGVMQSSSALSLTLVIQEAVKPFIEELGEVREELGHVKAQKEALQLRVLELETSLSMSSTSPNASQSTKEHDEKERGLGASLPSQNDTQPPTRSIIERLRRLFTGTA